jgi:cytidylate kinase
VILTLSRSYGSAGHQVALGLAERLGYRLVDDDLPRVVAARLGTSAASVAAIEERESDWGARILRSLGAGVPETAVPPGANDLDLVARRELERAIREAAEAGNAIVIGRAAGAILRERRDLVRAFVTASLAWRVARIAASFGVDEKTARDEIARVDGARRTYGRERYGIAWGDAAAYDVTVDSERLGVAGCVETIAAALRAAERLAR